MRAPRPHSPNHGIPDELLMDRYVDGDGAAFDELFRRYEKRAFWYFARRTRSPERAEDLYQELFLRIHRGRDAYDARLPFSPWFFQIAHRLLIDDQRRAYRKREVSLEGSPAGTSFRVETDEVPDREHLSQLLAGLSETERSILIAAKLEGVGYAEIALAQGKSVDAVKKMASRALQRIRCAGVAEAAAGLRGT